MMDVLMIALALGLFALAIGYAHAIDRNWGEWVMVFDYSLAALVALGLLIYLIYALLRPERFWSLSRPWLSLVDREILRVDTIDMEWRPITTAAPFDRYLELAVIDANGIHRLAFPCRRVLRGWIKARTNEPVASVTPSGLFQFTLLLVKGLKL
jgi:K+-transporting ATPase KdpF subunit